MALKKVLAIFLFIFISISILFLIANTGGIRIVQTPSGKGLLSAFFDSGSPPGSVPPSGTYSPGRDIKIPSTGDNDAPGRLTGLVVIDPGHGGIDPGTSNKDKLLEKDISLDVALMVNTMLSDAGIQTYMTRTADKSLELRSRIDIANQKKASLFVSIHVNWYEDSSLHGVTTLYYPSGTLCKGNLFEIDYARIMQKALVASLDARSIGIEERPNLAVLRHAQMPSVIVELGFLSNKKEAELLASHDYREKAAEGIVKGIQEALKTASTGK